MRASNFNQIVWLFLAVCIVSACASNKSNKLGHYYLSGEQANEQKITKKYRLTHFKLTLDDNSEAENYPKEQELNDTFIELLNSELRKQDKYSPSNGMEVSIVMDYHRIFVGGAFHASTAYGSNKCNYTSRLSVAGNEIALLSDEPMTRTSMNDDNKSFFKNLARIGSQLTMSGNREDEAKDIRTCAQRIVERLPE